ncbi:hypothetical protein CLOHAE12215_02582 [Clostridium haemolyticum]|uniref:DEAD/DEAH box helicase family protein n=1 Tax=Clostridium haemolyticum TaxID=84025 RepID=UPI001C3A1153|nr:DEAD/DEAH box helicase family protein [Clostridium haemolyticum]CAG7841158.1 hypothetical protein CLOHAE12215_02582 [Clostridium haemolyticum]
MIKKRVSELITVQEIKKWAIGDVVTITAGTGAGKSYFIKNVLYAFAKANNKKILYLIHRDNCDNQFIKELERDHKTDIIKILTYQSLEYLYINHNKTFDFSMYEYVICDEYHYFLNDSTFNNTTDVSFNMIMNNTSSTKIFMSATSNKIKRYIKEYKNINTVDYELPISFDFIEDLNFYNSDKHLIKIIDNAIQNKEKVIVFLNNIESALNLYEIYRDHALFNCSKSNKKYYRHVNSKKIDRMLENEKFDEDILITTSCFDAGVNIIDTYVKHIICDIKDVDCLIQCVGRKRIQNNNDKIHLYIKDINNNVLGQLKGNLNKKIEVAECLINYGVEALITRYGRKDYFNIVYDDVELFNHTKKVNELMYFKCITDLQDIEYMLGMGKYGYRKFIANKLKINNYKTLVNEEIKTKDELENYLNSILGQVMLQVKDRKELIEKIDVRSNGKQLKKINNLNGALEERNIPYRIIEFATSKTINGKQKRYPNAWKVQKLIY